ncbi:MAG: response regulator transcription factor [Myxococcales bacterium]|nr:response regulator transcription factor [Myxococcales bacterium]
MIRVFIADDHSVVREGLARILSAVAGLGCSGQAADVHGLLSSPALDQTDVVVLDVSLPGGGGAEALRCLRRDRPDIPVVVHSMYPEEQYGARFIRAGAAAYLSKDRSTSELLDAIRRVHQGRRYLTDLVADALATGPVAGEAHDVLSARELQVLQLHAEGRQTNDIARELFISASTVSTHFRNIKDKLGLQTTAELVQYAFRHKLVV